MFLRSTDLPVPDGPMTAVVWPRGMSKVMSFRTVCDPKDFVTPRREMTASSGSPFPAVDVTVDTPNLVQCRRRSAQLAPGLRPSLGVEALEAGLGRVVDEAHRLGDGVVAGLVGDEPVHLLAHDPVGRVALRAWCAAPAGAWPPGR